LSFGASPFIPDNNISGALQKEFERQLPKFNALPEPVAPSPIEKTQEESQNQVTVTVKGFRFEGAHLISDEELQSELQSWVGKKVSFNELQKAADQIAEIYRKQHLLAQTNIPPQDFQQEDAIILIKILEAKLGAIRIDPEQKGRFKQGLMKDYILFDSQLGEHFYTNRIERSLYLLNELPGVAIDSEIEPGDNDGEVALRLKFADKPLVSGYGTLSNYGGTSTGVIQGLINFNMNNLSGYGDQVTLTTISSLGSQYGQIGYSIPVGASGLKAGITISNLYYSTIGDFAGSQGSSTNWGGNLSYPLLRTQSTNANLSLAYLNKSNYNYNLTTASLVSNYVINEYTFGISGNHYDSFWIGGVTNASINFVSGNFSMLPDSAGLTYGQFTAPTFSKLTFSVTRNQQIIPDKMILNININGQFASGNLDGVERFYLGGANGVRAYPTSQGSGDQGAMLNLDLQYQFPGNVLGYVFYDIGVVDQFKDINTFNALASNTNAGNRYSLSGFGLGAKYSLYGVNLNGLVALQLGENPLFRFDSASKNFVPQNNDGTTNSVYFWLQANYPF
jgi:hemolysin activation/secretion protein